MFNSILVVCTGNICRSPIGERLLQKEFPGKKVDSAGIDALVDHPADQSSVEVAERHDLSLAGHKARQLSRRMLNNYDLILAMDKSHIDFIDRLAPEVRGKTMLYGHWLGGKEIPDPYRKSQDVYDIVWQLIEQASKGWTTRL
ncbi:MULTISPECIES: protein tyrosine phosphatase [Klebsiella]|uniref:arsenate reductase/protein-tyrosine-phosphatase family protein n=1 Tax=Klebsiella TaxID=570 RepID=UPI000B3EDE30|nr:MULTISPECIES: protein tyrosine phosphatase [Klebsiella]AXO69056.1 protein tyrosine phosphatase [Klebsiella variicola]ELI6993989.1 protein tyrosine phosphatase [Klebsiella pneumoniae]MBD3909106.1 protein tyrosine phosphatase [Klebsiella pneumoniae]OUY93226.1 protein tyrosine phosphatase [Klebsiella variicola]PLK31588.1 protein tyrosine phosphatase [Klebsiella variicola]